MKLWLIEFTGDVDYDYVNAAVVRAPSEDRAWEVFKAAACGSLYFRHQYQVTRLHAAGPAGMIVQDVAEG